MEWIESLAQAQIDKRDEGPEEPVKCCGCREIIDGQVHESCMDSEVEYYCYECFSTQE